jgi:murein DD-endopeptidase MepM/ murein hydrolase activator NlpD
MAAKIRSRTRALFEKAFPERQIYHRSGGSVTFVKISPWRQAAMAAAGTIVIAWCLFATAAVLLRSPSAGGAEGKDGRIARYERELAKARANEAIALSLLEQRTTTFEADLDQLEDRHETIKKLLAHMQGGGGSGGSAPLVGDGRQILVDSSIDEADERQSRPSETISKVNDKAGFRAKFDAVRNDQTAFLDIAEEEAVERAEHYRGVLRQTGAPVTKVIETLEMGGPLIELPPLAADGEAGVALDDGFTLRAREVVERLEEARLFETVIHTLPLGAPIAEPYRETSGFGSRPDPFTRRNAWHDGVDLAKFYGAPITATAPGVVSFAGVKSGYGRVVEVDHGKGFKTRYGHLQSITAKVGAKVAIGQKIGTMGSTGRSTGPHLHYEVYYNGKSYDPIKFLRAGKHVYKG